jgi:hypothetical protein
MGTYGKLLAEVRKLQDENKLPTYPTVAQQIDWAHGNAAMENPAVTIEIVQGAMLKISDKAVKASK